MNIENLSFSYRKNIVFKNFCFNFEKNNIYLLVGTNGSGKTTLLKILSNLIVSKYHFKKSFLVLDNNDLPEHLSVFNYLKLYSKDTENIYYYLSKFKVKNVLIKSLSRGTRQKINIIISFLVNKEILLFDEVESFVDKEGIKIFIEEMKKIDLENKIIILSTHNTIKYKQLVTTLCSLN